MNISSLVLRTSYLWVVLAAVPVFPQARPLDTARSSITIRVGRTGVFSFAGDNHLVRAPLASGSVNEAGKHIEFKVQSKSLRVEDPGTAANKRAQIQERMLGPDVLDSEHFPVIQFRSTSISGAPADLRVAGDLTLRGQTRPIESKVQQIAKVASPVDWFAADVKVYQTRLMLTTDGDGLRPGMSAEVRIETDRKPKVLQIPVQATSA